ncbi:MAG: hypothetical protein EHM70_10285 [Chloroflexota bacterium]|nr:MAG: hypothetical protein EHM70_10285 [Chloroflexota bacterium]
MWEKSEYSRADILALYERFQAPITKLNCGEKCSPYNENGVPFCCDTHHAVPTAYLEEWEYLRENTDLWHLWESEDPAETQRLKAETPHGQVMIACQGHTRCQRGFRSITCRSFPFFPYVTLQGDFTGLSYYWQYEDRCWVISNLHMVTPQYCNEFIAAFDALFEQHPSELENFRHHSTVMRRVFGRQRRAIPLLHRNGKMYKITPSNGRMRQVRPERLPKFGPYQVASLLRFPDEE